MQTVPASSMEDPKQPRSFQACTQCRNRKLKCIMEPADGVCAPPCKRCRRESKQCEVPESKRKRYPLESASKWTPAKREQVKQSLEAASRPVSPAPELPPTSTQGQAVREVSSYSQQVGPRPGKRQRTSYEPAIRDSDDLEDSYVISTAAPWALDFLPVTFCATIADLSQAYEYQSSVVSTDATSPPSTVDGDERQERERTASPEKEEGARPQTVSMADMHNDTPAQVDDARTASLQRKQRLPDDSHGSTGVSFEQDLGLDGLFDYIRFG